jgi:hypothetical protein
MAGTWVGAETDSLGRFIQIGTNEGRMIPPADTKLGISPTASGADYDAFWSDSAHHFHPVFLGPVHAGERIHASVSWIHGRWRLSIDDAALALHVHFTTQDESGPPAEEAEWLQEDVGNGAASYAVFHYPRLSAVGFQDVRVNGAAPSPAGLEPDSMHPNGTLTDTPSPLHRDAFRILTATRTLRPR